MGEARPKKLRFALPPPLPCLRVGQGRLQGHILDTLKKVPLDRPVPLLFLAYPESSLLRTCIPAYLTAVALRIQRVATPGSAVCVHGLTSVCRAAQRGHGALRDVGSV